MPAQVELSSAWWDKNGAKTLQTGLGKSLPGYEKAVKAFEKAVAQNVSSQVDGLYGQMVAALKQVGIDVQNAHKKCNKVVHKDTMANLQTLMTKNLPAEQKRVTEAYNKWSAKRNAARAAIVDRSEKLSIGITKQGNELQAEWVQVDKLHDTLMKDIAQKKDKAAGDKQFDVLEKEARGLVKATQDFLKAVDTAVRQNNLPEIDVKVVPPDKKMAVQQQYAKWKAAWDRVDAISDQIRGNDQRKLADKLKQAKEALAKLG